ncbi:MAG TPA: hypothetical protein PLI27_06405 [Ignavibacteriales bacterium]|nr:hypothetical protein [Ignavibacteriales bacterium]HRT98670.1 hypothetical protein [Ignavibacteriales bacterium]
MQASTNTYKAKQIIELYNRSKTEFWEITRSQYAVPILDAFLKSL